MCGFIIICFAAMAVAAPQGYTYPGQLNNVHFAPATEAASTFAGHSMLSYLPQPLISKRFFIHSAPEEEQVEVQQRHIVVGQPRKNFNVVFIKSPTRTVQKTKIRIIPASNEEKTAIYVFAKKDTGSDVIAHVEEPLGTTAKPEVFFIKYKTNEEAEYAQQNIQAEYDRLGGTSITSNEGIASVSSVIGSLGTSESAASGSQSTMSIQSSYLPPIKKY